MFDVNGDGKVPAEEFLTWLEFSDSEIEMIFTDYDYAMMWWNHPDFIAMALLEKLD